MARPRTAVRTQRRRARRQREVARHDRGAAGRPPTMSTSARRSRSASRPTSTSRRATTLHRHLHALQPWRKGPFSLFGVQIDTEWRSDWKWNRVAPHLSPLAGRRVLDVGCGNGYYGWRMCAAGAARDRHRSDDRLLDAVPGGSEVPDRGASAVRPRAVADTPRRRPAAATRSTRCCRWACSTTAAIRSSTCARCTRTCAGRRTGARDADRR